MAMETRSKTGNSKPRILDNIEPAPPKPRDTKTKTATKTKMAPKAKVPKRPKANTSEPRDKTVASGRVEKKKVPAAVLARITTQAVKPHNRPKKVTKAAKAPTKKTAAKKATKGANATKVTKATKATRATKTAAPPAKKKKVRGV